MIIKRFTLTLLFAFIISSSFAQTKDSLISILKTNIHDTTRISVLQKLSKNIQNDQLDSSILILENTVRFCNTVSKKYSGSTLYQIQKKKSLLLYNLGGNYATKGDSANQLFYLRKCQDLRHTLHDTIGLIDVYIAKGLFFSEHGKFQKGLNYFSKALKLSTKAKFQKGIAESHNNIGYVQNNNGQVDKALESYYKALLIQEEIQELKGAASTLNNIAFIYYQQDNFNKALEYWKKSLDYRIQTKNNKLISHSLNNLGSVYYNLGETQKALEYFERSYKIQLKMGDKQAGAYSLNNIGFIYNQKKDYDKAQKHWEECLKIRREINDKKGQVYSLQNLSSLYLNKKEYKKALKLAQESVKLSKEIGIISLEKKSYHRLYKVYYKLNLYKDALLNFTKYVTIKDSLLNDRNTKALAERDAKYKYDIKQIADSISYQKELKIKDIKLSQQKAIVQKQKTQQYALYVGIVLILTILALVYRMLKTKHRANELLQKQKKEIEDQTTELYTQNEEIQAQRDEIEFQKSKIEDIHANVKDSIAYAKNIQNAMLSETKSLKNDFNDAFVLFKPKDVVSGDFYWWTKVENQTVITAADCTGHGVPGAFMSMLGISFLREIVNKEYITHTGVILRKLRKEIVKSLKQKSETSELTLRDGMDMAIVSINHQTNIIQFSGANNPIYIIRKKELKIEDNAIKLYETEDNPDFKLYEIKPDKMPIAMYDNMSRFTTHEIQVNEGDLIYMFSDGFADQFGGPKGKKFKYKPFKQLLIKNCQLSMEEQKAALEKTFQSWKGGIEQVDDVVILGIKI